MGRGRGQLTSYKDRQQAVRLIETAVAEGARQSKACAILGLNQRTYQRWRCLGEVKPDGRTLAVRPPPPNKLSSSEHQLMRSALNDPCFANLPPSQIVPKLADQERYIASESSFYRLMKAEKRLSHRSRAKAPRKHNLTTHKATAINQLWCWDITWLPGPAAGFFFYLYLILDVFSRKIMAWEIHLHERSTLAAEFVQKAFWREGLHKTKAYPLVLHSDNGSPMKGCSLQTKLADLGIIPSFSRPRVSNDNAYAEAFFRTTKYHLSCPYQGFSSLVAAQQWMNAFVDWYNNHHQHSGLNFITPSQRHSGVDQAIFAKRTAVYEQARAKNPQRWSKNTRNWSLSSEVYLNPEKTREKPR